MDITIDAFLKLFYSNWNGNSYEGFPTSLKIDIISLKKNPIFFEEAKKILALPAPKFFSLVGTTQKSLDGVPRA